MEAPGIRVPAKLAELTRRRLMAEGQLRTDLRVAKIDEDVVFPTQNGPSLFDFEPIAPRARHYTQLLDGTPEVLAAAPRAFDRLGDTVLVKVPEAWQSRVGDLGQALLEFTEARAVFQDRGVVGEFRTRDLELIAGHGSSRTLVAENGARLHVDPAAAYYSPRLADERARVATALEPGQRLIDLFGGVAPLGVQAAKRGADVVSIDLNPAAVALARVNCEANKVSMDLREGDARAHAIDLEPAHHVVMNLPHGAKHFLDAAAPLVLPGGVLHYHEILEDRALPSRQKEVEAELMRHGWTKATIENVRHVRAYSATASHVCMDVRR